MRLLLLLSGWVSAACTGDAFDAVRPAETSGLASPADAPTPDSGVMAAGGAADPEDAAVGTSGAGGASATQFPEAGAASGGSNSLSDAARPMCSAGVCVALESVPEWRGPMRFRDVASEAMIGAACPSETARFYRDLAAPPAQCDCRCEPEDYFACVERIHRHTSAPSCQDDIGREEQEVVPNECVVPDSEYIWIKPDQSDFNESCEPVAATPKRVMPRWEQAVAACGLEAGEECSAGLQCITEGEKLCIYREGEFDCPEGTSKETYFQSYEDTRGCGECRCGKFNCPVLALLYDNNLCEGTGTPVAGNTCTSVKGSLSIAAGQCKATRAATGSAVPNAPMTLCCTGGKEAF